MRSRSGHGSAKLPRICQQLVLIATLDCNALEQMLRHTRRFWYSHLVRYCAPARLQARCCRGKHQVHHTTFTLYATNISGRITRQAFLENRGGQHGRVNHKPSSGCTAPCTTGSGLVRAQVRMSGEASPTHARGRLVSVSGRATADTPSRSWGTGQSSGSDAHQE